MCRKAMLCMALALWPALLNAANPSPGSAPKDYSANNDIQWGYIKGENGPSEWAQLNRKEWGTCSDGHMQSPLQVVDLEYDCGGQCSHTAATWTGDPANTFRNGEHRRLSLNGLQPITQGQTQNNGHSIVVNVPPSHKKMYTVFEGRKYELLQFHFHRRAEHQVNGYQYPMELHLVHKGSDGNLMVVGIFFQETDNANLFLNGLGFKSGGLPIGAGQRVSIPRAVNPLGVVDDMSVYNSAATDQMRNSIAQSLKLQLTGWALSPRTVLAMSDFERAWNEVASSDLERSRILRDAYIFNNPAPAGSKDAMDRPPMELTESYHDIHLKHHPYYRKMLYDNNYYDIFILDTLGNLVYSVYKELDYATKFTTDGRYGSSGLGKAFRASMANPTGVNEIPWEPYEPSYGALASFVATGIQVDGVTIGVFCIQLPPEAINEAIAAGTYIAGRRLLAASAAAPAPAGQDAASWRRSALDEACALRLNQLRIDSGCHSSAVAHSASDGHRRRAGGGDSLGGSRCPTCPSLREEGTMDIDYWTYQGSLTTPPCTEGVTWVLVKQPSPATSIQIGTFPFRDNFRPPQPIFSRSIYSGSGPAWDWGYAAHNGPHTWAANGYSFCGGEHQSPVNIETDKVNTYTHFDFIPQYLPQHNLYVINTGRSVEVQLRLTKLHISEEVGVKADFEFQSYFLTTIQFHKESEHLVNGQRFPLEAQFWHRQEGEEDLAPNLVVSVLFDLSEECNPQLDQLNWGQLPQERDVMGVHVPDSFIVEDLMPMSRNYWTYDGTLTKPPCTPGVQWVIFQEHRTVCQSQLDRFPLHNSRPVQPIDDRVVQYGSFRASDGVSDDFWHWDYYHGYRPVTWGRYYPACVGSNQSPVNIMTANLVDHGSNPDVKRLEKKWHSICGVRVRNNGHTVVVDMPAGHTIFEDEDWRVMQFHFHAPSETQIDGKSFPLEVHVVHLDTVGAGRNLVMAVLFNTGSPNAFLEMLDWHSLPPLPHSKSEEETHSISRPVDLNMLLNNKNSGMDYYAYEGSLTTPPCTEGVRWVVMTEPDHLGANQLLMFYNVLHHTNFRTPQPLNGRLIHKNSPPHEINEKDLWGYSEENGPSTWGAAGFPSCLEKMQSPIDVETDLAVRHAHYALDWKDWQGTSGPGQLYVENDHNRIFAVKGFGAYMNKITFEGQYFFLKRMEFHKRSETRMNGEQFDFEIHFIHHNEVGMQLYLVQLYKADGGDNNAISKLNWNQLNSMMLSDEDLASGRMTTQTRVNVNFSPMELIDLMGLDKTNYPNGPMYYHYDGSMSTPPCTEGVTWIVMEQISKMSEVQLAQYPMSQSIRPVMDIGSRKVHYLSSIDPQALYAASKANHEDRKLVHNANHNMADDSGVSGAALVRSSQILALKLQLMKWAKDARTAIDLKEFKDTWDAMAANDEERASLLRDAYIFDNPHPFGSKDTLDRPPESLTQAYHDTHLRIHPYYRRMLYDNNYYDIFILDTQGNLIYSVYKELDYATKFTMQGRYGNSGLGKAFRAAMANPMEVNEIPWEPYEPSYGALASFVATGVQDVNGVTIGVFCIQLPPEARSTELAGRRRADPPPAEGYGASKDAIWQYGYEVENGPLKWARYVPSCIGFTQSPINIEECQLTRRDQNKLFPTWHFTKDLKIENNGHALVVNGIKDSFTMFEGERYEVLQFHFHAGSEHLLHGEQYPLELHIVHTKDGRPALVIGLLFDVGAENVDLTSLYFGDERRIPQRAGQASDLMYPFNPVHFMPYNKNYYSYDGSLTTPPCTEGLRWIVMQSRMSASAKQVASFPFKNNFRNPQPLLGRPVYFFSEQDRYLYQTVAGSAGALHVMWTLVLSAAALSLGLLQ